MFFQLGINQRSRRLHNRRSYISRALHPTLHQHPIHKQEKLIGEHVWLLRTSLHREITETCTHVLFVLGSDLMGRMVKLRELNGRMQTGTSTKGRIGNNGGKHLKNRHQLRPWRIRIFADDLLKRDPEILNGLFYIGTD